MELRAHGTVLALILTAENFRLKQLLNTYFLSLSRIVYKRTQ